MSKQAQVGQTKAQAPQPRQRSDCCFHIGLLKALSTCSFTCSLVNLASTFASTDSLSTSSAALNASGNNAISCLPLSVITSASASVALSSVICISLPSTLPGPPPTDVQKQQASLLLHAKLTIVSFALRASYILSL